MRKSIELSPVMAVNYAHQRRHYPAQGGLWKIPVDLIAEGNRKGRGFVEVRTQSPVLSDPFVAEIRRACRKLREQRPMAAFGQDGSFAGLYQRVD
jgi:hypothetical protein